MKLSEIEAIKLRASYLNGLAIVVMATGLIAPIFSVIYVEPSFWKLLATWAVVPGAGFASWELHEFAQSRLKLLDKE